MAAPFGGFLKIDAAVIDAGDGDHYHHVIRAIPRKNAAPGMD